MEARYKRRPAFRRPSRWIAALGLAAALLLLALPGLVRATSDTITDLPVYGNWPISCGWHLNCNPPDPRRPGIGYRPDEGGVDIAVPSGTLVHAAGHGENGAPAEVIDAGYHRNYGYFVDIDHGPDISTYAHLNWYFLTEGQRVCRHVAVGYSGASGGVTGAHLHFEGDAAPDQFDPIWGSGSQYNNAHFRYDPYAVPRQTQPRVSHNRVQTQAYTVDEVQASEFFLHGPVRRANGWREGFVGFSYMGEAAGHTWFTHVGSDARMATWDPILPVADPGWQVYAFIPHEYATARRAHYRVEWWDPQQGWLKTDVYVDQSQFDNEWVRLENASHQSFPTTGPGQWQLSVKLINDCAASGASGCASGDRLLAADAMMFVPSDCGD